MRRLLDRLTSLYRSFTIVYRQSNCKQTIIFGDDNKYKLEISENMTGLEEFPQNIKYGGRCGEIFTTLKGTFTIVCTVCGLKFNNFNKYAAHYKQQHKYQFQSSTDAKEKMLEHSFIESQEALQEIEFPITALRKSDCDYELDSEQIESMIKTEELDVSNKEIADGNCGASTKCQSIQKEAMHFKLFNSRRHKCTFPSCTGTFKDKAGLTKHLSRHTTEKRHQCPDCEKNFYTIRDLKRHRVRNHPKRRSLFKMEPDTNETEHIVEHRNVSDYEHDPKKTENIKTEQTIISSEQSANENCETATKSRPVRKKLMYFQPLDDRIYKCTYSSCAATFKNTANLRIHLRRHTTEKCHQCPQCNKKYYTSTDLRIHLRSHARNRPFLCSICGKTCISGTKLKDHMRRHTNERNYKCSHCDKCFYNASSLGKHQAVHSNVRAYKCTICDARFAYSKGLRNHLKLHENKRAYKCELCDAAFNQQAGLFGHMKNNHKNV